MKKQSYWVDTTSKKYASHGSALPENADLLVVGGGISGLSTAWHALQAGLSVVICEKDSIGEGSTVHSAGMLTIEPGLEYYEVEQKYGLWYAKEMLQAYQYALDSLEKFVQDHNIDCGYMRLPSYAVAEHADESAEVRIDFDLKRKLGLKSSFVDESESKKTFAHLNVDTAIKTEGNGAMNPAQFVHGLAQLVEEAGGIICENTEVLNWEKTVAGFTVQTSHGTVSAKHVSVNADSHIYKWYPELQPLFNSKESLCVTAPIEDVSAFMPNALVWNLYWLFEYYRVLPDNRILFGSTQTMRLENEDGLDEDGLRVHDPVPVEEMQAYLNAFFVNAPEELTIDYLWSGNFAISGDELPYVGQMPDETYAAGGYNGHGLLLGFISGELIVGGITGKYHPLLHLFSPSRKRGLRDKLYRWLPSKKLRHLGLRMYLTALRFRDSLDRRS